VREVQAFVAWAAGEAAVGPMEPYTWF